MKNKSLKEFKKNLNQLLTQVAPTTPPAASGGDPKQPPLPPRSRRDATDKETRKPTRYGQPIFDRTKPKNRVYNSYGVRKANSEMLTQVAPTTPPAPTGGDPKQPPFPPKARRALSDSEARRPTRFGQPIFDGAEGRAKERVYNSYGVRKGNGGPNASGSNPNPQPKRLSNIEIARQKMQGVIMRENGRHGFIARPGAEDPSIPITEKYKSLGKSVTLGQSFAAPMPMPYRNDGVPDWASPPLGCYVSFSLENGPLKGRVVVLKRQQNGMYVIASDDAQSKNNENRDLDKEKLNKEDPSQIQTAQDQINHDLNEIQSASDTTKINKGIRTMGRSMRKAEVAVTNPQPIGTGKLTRRDWLKIGAGTLGAKVAGDKLKELSEEKGKSWDRSAKKAYISPHADRELRVPDRDESGGAVAGKIQGKRPNRRDFLTAAGAGAGSLIGRGIAQVMSEGNPPARQGGQARRLRQSWDPTAKSQLVFPVQPEARRWAKGTIDQVPLGTENYGRRVGAYRAKRGDLGIGETRDRDAYDASPTGSRGGRERRASDPAVAARNAEIHARAERERQAQVQQILERKNKSLESVVRSMVRNELEKNLNKQWNGQVERRAGRRENDTFARRSGVPLSAPRKGQNTPSPSKDKYVTANVPSAPPDYLSQFERSYRKFMKNLLNK